MERLTPVIWILAVLCAFGPGAAAQEWADFMPIHEAAATSLAEVVEKMLAERPSLVHRRDEDGLTPLHHAARLNRQEVAQLLLDWGAEHDIFTAAGLGDTEACAAILAEDPDAVNARDPAAHESPLRWAVSPGYDKTPHISLVAHEDTAHLLLRHGAHHDVFTAAGLGEVDVLRRITGAKADSVQSRDWHGDTPLHWAALNGRVEAVRLLLAGGASLDTRNAEGVTPLLYALVGNQYEAAELLLGQGADPNRSVVVALDEETEERTSPLEIAAVWSDGAAVELLLQYGAEVQSGALAGAVRNGDVPLVERLLSAGEDLDLGYALWLAAAQPHPEIVEALLAAGAQPDQPDEVPCHYGGSPLAGAARGGSRELAQILLDAGADINGGAPLVSAAWGKHEDMIVFLLDRGADVNVRHQCDTTALHVAARDGLEEIARTLLQHGADTESTVVASWGEIFPRDPCGLRFHDPMRDLRDEARRGVGGAWTPLQAAAAHGHLRVVHILLSHGASIDANGSPLPPLHVAAWNGHHDVVRSLLFRGAEVDSRDHRGATCLHVAAASDDRALAELLLAEGAAIDARDEDGASPLHHAAHAAQEDAAAFLLERGADVSAVDERGRTPLHWAARTDAVGVAAMLLGFGADLSATDKRGETALEMAREYDSPRIAELLHQHGATD